MTRIALEPIETPFGRVLTTLLDGNPAWKLECPSCGKWGWLDEDQLFGRVSVDHTDTGCSYHETHDFAAAMAAEVCQDKECPLLAAGVLAHPVGAHENWGVA